jgi:hypothetical protein
MCKIAGCDFEVAKPVFDLARVKVFDSDNPLFGGNNVQRVSFLNKVQIAADD